MTADGSLPAPRADQQTPSSSAGVAPGAAAGIFRGRLVIVYGTGPGSGIFEYSPTPGPGNLVASLTAASTDPYGNQTVNTTGFTGLALYNNSQGLAIGLFPQGLQVFTGSLSAGWTAADVSLAYSATQWGLSGPLKLVSSNINVAAELLCDPVTGALVTSLIEAFAPASTSPETWHNIGATGQPAFGSGWSNVGSGNEICRFQLAASPPNSVRIRGYVNNATAANTAAIFTLPSGYLPTYQQIFPTVENGITYGNSIVVQTNGAVKTFNSAGTGNYQLDLLVSLD